MDLRVPASGDLTVRIRSDSSSAFYFVRRTAAGFTCTCPDFGYRQPAGGCKHIIRVRNRLSELAAAEQRAAG